ncbi:hypothetical protein EMIT0357P_20545 [Pseudomonas marginalis]
MGQQNRRAVRYPLPHAAGHRRPATGHYRLHARGMRGEPGSPGGGPAMSERRFMIDAMQDLSDMTEVLFS